MGLGLHCQMAIPSGMAASPLSRIEEIALEHAEASGLRVFFSASQKENHLWLYLHPAAEPFEFELLEGGTLSCDAKTSSVGPGYHRYLVGLLDALAIGVGSAWNFDSDEADDTGYAAHRDFDALQASMTGLLRDLSKIIVERSEEGAAGLMLNMPFGFAPALGTDVATPMGEFSREVFVEACEDEASLGQLAPTFFPWWEEGMTAKSWRDLGLTVMWMDVQWRPPVDEQDGIAAEIALRCMETARALDATIAIPEAEVAELRMFLAEDPASGSGPEAAPSGIGYRRRHWRFETTGGWTVEAPGYFQERFDNDGTTFVCWHRHREIWFTSFSIEPARPARPSDVAGKPGDQGAFIEHFGIVGRAIVQKKVGGDGDSYFSMDCTFQGFGSSAVLTIVYSTGAEHGWAMDVFRSVRFSPTKPAEDTAN